MDEFREELEKRLLTELTNLENYPVGSEESKDAMSRIDKLFRIQNEDFKTQIQEADSYERLTRREQEDKAKMKLARFDTIQKWLPRPDTVFNGSLIVGLTLLVIKYDKEGSILPIKLLKYVDKIKFLA